MPSLSRGVTRFAVSLQYHGSSFLGFSWQRGQEDCLLPDGTDLRGYRSVEGRLREALTSFLHKDRTDPAAACRDDDGDDDESFANIQVSSRTDRGVHALHNTLHVDILNRPDGSHWSPEILHRGLNSHLSHPLLGRSDAGRTHTRSIHHATGLKLPRGSAPMNEMRILNVRVAPTSMSNPYVAAVEQQQLPQQPSDVDWNARYSATERTYLYRILSSPTRRERDWGTAFEWDRAWRIQQSLNLAAMQEAAAYLQGTHDVSSFRAAGCQRKIPVVTLYEVSLHTQPYGPPLGTTTVTGGSGLLHLVDSPSPDLLLTTIVVRGNAFVYRQVRNMVGCLVAVGKGRIDAQSLPALLATKDRRQAPSTAPAHGLYLARVRHGDFQI